MGLAFVVLLDNPFMGNIKLKLYSLDVGEAWKHFVSMTLRSVLLTVPEYL